MVGTPIAGMGHCSAMPVIDKLSGVQYAIEGALG